MVRKRGLLCQSNHEYNGPPAKVSKVKQVELEVD